MAWPFFGRDLPPLVDHGFGDSLADGLTSFFARDPALDADRQLSHPSFILTIAMAPGGATLATAVSELIPLPLLDSLEGRLADVPAPDLGQELVDISRLMDRLDSTRIRLLRRFDEARAYEQEGALSTVSWLRSMCRLPGYGAIQRVSMARQLEDLPDTAAALASGEIGYHHAVQIFRVAEEVGAEAVRKEEKGLITTAKVVDPGRFGLVTADLRYRTDAQGVLDDANHQHDLRQLWIRQMFDGHYDLKGRLDAEGGAMLKAALDAVDGPPTIGSGAAAAFYHRQADALVDLARRQLEIGELPDVGGERPHLTITASIDTLSQLRGHPAGQIEDGSLLHAETVRRIACDAALTRVVMKGEVQPVSVGRTTRTISTTLRKALVVRDKGCRFPHCQRKPAWTDGHHVKHWADGGETNLDNLLLLCRRHHRLVHEGRWLVVRKADGRVMAFPPPRRMGDPNYLPELARAG